MSAVAFEAVTLKLGGTTILSDVTLAIEEGEFVGMLGPNGAGKTTMMRSILGLVPAASGAITLFGRPARLGNRDIGYLPQSKSGAGWRLSGHDFVLSAVQGHRWGLPIPSRAERAEVQRVLELVGASDLANRPLASLSGGQRQRLLLAQALTGRPRLLLLDEPLISLDPHRQRSVIDLVRGLQKELGIAVLFSAHEINPLLGALDRVLYLGGGQAALGPVDEVITTPVLSRLYGARIDVVRLDGRIFVLSDRIELDPAEHRHDV